MKAKFYNFSRSGEFTIGAPYRALKLQQPGNGAKWVLHGTRLGVSAQVWERCCDLNFYTKRDALAALDLYTAPDRLAKERHTVGKEC